MQKHRITALVATVAVAGGGAALATAAPTKPAAPAKQFQSRLASELGVSQAKLASATKGSGVATVEALKASGKIKPARAAKLEQAIRAGRTAPFMRLGAAGAKRAPGVRLLASAISKTPKEVRAALKGGATPARVIADAGKDPAAVKRTIQAAIRARLQKRVTAGKLTAAAADERATKRATRLTADTALKGAKGKRAAADRG